MTEYRLSTFIENESLHEWLLSLNIESASAFLRAFGLQRERERYLAYAPIDSITLEYWLSIADLIRVQGIGPRYAQQLVARNIRSIQDLIASDVDTLFHSLSQSVSINKEQIGNWITAARQLELQIDISSTPDEIPQSLRFTRKLSLRTAILASILVMLFLSVGLAVIGHLGFQELSERLTNSRVKALTITTLRTMSAIALFGSVMAMSISMGFLVFTQWLYHQLIPKTQEWFSRTIGPSYLLLQQRYLAAHRELGYRYFVFGIVTILALSTSLLYPGIRKLGESGDLSAFLSDSRSLIGLITLGLSSFALLGYPVIRFCLRQRSVIRNDRAISAFLTHRAVDVTLSFALIAIALQIIMPTVFTVSYSVSSYFISSHNSERVEEVIKSLRSIEANAESERVQYEARISIQYVTNMKQVVRTQWVPFLEKLSGWIHTISSYGIWLALITNLLIYFFTPLLIIRGKRQAIRTIITLALSVILPLLAKRSATAVLASIPVQGLSITLTVITIFVVVLVDELKAVHNVTV